MTPAQLLAILPACPRDKASEYTLALVAAMTEASINTVTRAAAFVAQIAWESGELRYWEEKGDGHGYEGRKDLGNTQTGDGPRYKGRGPIQLTGRTNYRVAGAALGVDLEAQPELAATARVGFRVAAWYWTSHHLNERADVFDFAGITRAINGAASFGPPSWLERRTAYYQRALEVLGREALVA